VVAILSSFLTSQWANVRQRVIFDEIYSKKIPPEKWTSLKNGWATFTLVLNISSIIFFMVGTTSLACFSISNLYGGERMAEQKKDYGFVSEKPEKSPLEKGVVPPKPTLPPKPPDQPAPGSTPETGYVPPTPPTPPKGK